MRLRTITSAVHARAESASARVRANPTEVVRAFLHEEYGRIASQCAITLQEGVLSVRGCPDRVAQSLCMRTGELRTLLKGRTTQVTRILVG